MIRSPLVIRRLTPEDAGASWHLRRKALELEPLAFGKALEEHEQTTVAQSAGRIRAMPPESFILGAFAGNALVATATLFREPGLKERHKAHIYGVFVDPAHRSRGIGEQLLAALLTEARAQGDLEHLLLGVSRMQESAWRLYHRLGFEGYGTEPRALRVGSTYVDEDLLILRLRQD